MPRDELVKHVNRHFKKCHGDNNSSSSRGNIPHCETRSLLAGDYVWVARRRKTKQTTEKNDNSNSKKKEEIEERLLDCIIERKSFADLHTSLTTQSTRFHPLSRMQVQLHKLKASELSDTWLLLERETRKNSNQRWSGPSSAVRQTGIQFCRDIQQGRKYPGNVVLKYTQNVTNTVQFLIDQHERMCRRVALVMQPQQDVYHHHDNNIGKVICIDEDEATTKMDRLDTLEQRRTLSGAAAATATTTTTTTTTAQLSSPFAAIGTLEKMNHSIRESLGEGDGGNSSFLYYVQLRRVDQMGDNKARALIARFPTEHDLRTFCSGSHGVIRDGQPQRQRPKGKQKQSPVIAELMKLPLIGKVLAMRVLETFGLSGPPTGSDSHTIQPTTERQPTMTSTSLVSVVTPPPKLKSPPSPGRAAINSSGSSSERNRSCLSASSQQATPSQARRRVIPASFFEEDSDTSDEDELVQRVASMISNGPRSKRQKRQRSIQGVQQNGKQAVPSKYEGNNATRTRTASCPKATVVRDRGTGAPTIGKAQTSVVLSPPGARRKLAFPAFHDPSSQTKKRKMLPPEIIEID